MHGAALLLHSYLRWVALLSLAVSAVVALRAWQSQSSDRQVGRRIGLVSLITVDLQLLLGFLLYLWPGSVARAALSDMGASMANAGLRFWAVEHVSMMVLAVAVVHVGRILARRAQTAISAHRRAAVCWMISLSLIVAAIPWPFREAIGRPLLRLL